MLYCLNFGKKGIIFFLFATTILISVSLLYFPVLLVTKNRGPCVSVRTPNSTFEEVISYISPYIKKYGSINLLNNFEEEEFSFNEVLGIPACSNNDKKIEKEIPPGSCKIFPGGLPCEKTRKHTWEQTMKVMKKFLSIKSCRGSADLLAEKKLSNGKLMERYGILDSNVVTKGNIKRCVQKLRKSLQKDIPVTVVYEYGAKIAAGFSIHGKIFRQGRENLKEALRFPTCAKYGLVGTGGMGRFLLDIHGVQKVICHTPSACRYMRDLGYDVSTIKEL